MKKNRKEKIRMKRQTEKQTVRERRIYRQQKTKKKNRKNQEYSKISRRKRWKMWGYMVKRSHISQQRPMYFEDALQQVEIKELI